MGTPVTPRRWFVSSLHIGQSKTALCPPPPFCASLRKGWKQLKIIFLFHFEFGDFLSVAPHGSFYFKIGPSVTSVTFPTCFRSFVLSKRTKIIWERITGKISEFLVIWKTSKLFRYPALLSLGWNRNLSTSPQAPNQLKTDAVVCNCWPSHVPKMWQQRRLASLKVAAR